MSTAEDFLLMATDPESGKMMIGANASTSVLGGAILFDLVNAGRLGLEGDGRSARVVVSDHRAMADPVLEQAFARVRNQGRQVPQSTVARLGWRARKAIYASLALSGAVRSRGEKVLGLFPTTRHDILDTGRRDNLLNGVRACLLLDQPVDSRTGPVIGLLSAARQTKLVVDKPDRRRARARAEVLASGSWASEAVRNAILAAQSG